MLRPQNQIKPYLLIFCVQLLVSFVPFSGVKAQSMECQNLFKTQNSIQSIDVIEMSENVFHLQQTDEGSAKPFHFIARYSSDHGGSLSFDVFLVNYKMGSRSAMRGAQLYQQAVDYFADKQINRVLCSWTYSDNSREYYLNKSNGMSSEEAALNTWSGRQAQLHGFPFPIITYEWSPRDGELPNTQVLVEFYRTERTHWQRIREFFGSY